MGSLYLYTKTDNSTTETTVQDTCDSTYSQASYSLGACINMGRHECVLHVLCSELRICKCWRLRTAAPWRWRHYSPSTCRRLSSNDRESHPRGHEFSQIHHSPPWHALHKKSLTYPMTWLAHVDFLSSWFPAADVFLPLKSHCTKTNEELLPNSYYRLFMINFPWKIIFPVSKNYQILTCTDQA